MGPALHVTKQWYHLGGAGLIFSRLVKAGITSFPVRQTQQFNPKGEIPKCVLDRGGRSALEVGKVSRGVRWWVPFPICFGHMASKDTMPELDFALVGSISCSCLVEHESFWLNWLNSANPSVCWGDICLLFDFTNRKLYMKVAPPPPPPPSPACASASRAAGSNLSSQAARRPWPLLSVACSLRDQLINLLSTYLVSTNAATRGGANFGQFAVLQQGMRHGITPKSQTPRHVSNTSATRGE